MDLIKSDTLDLKDVFDVDSHIPCGRLSCCLRDNVVFILKRGLLTALHPQKQTSTDFNHVQ